MFKINIADKSGKTYKLELETEEFHDKSLHDKIDGKILLPDLEGYEFEISGTSDKSGFTSMKGVPGIGLKKVLLTYGKAMHKRPKHEGKNKRSNPTPKGLRLRKTVRGEAISSEITQINLKVLKQGAKKLSEVFASGEKKEETPAEIPKEVKPVEKPVEKPEEKKESKPEGSEPDKAPTESESSKEEKAHPDKEPSN